MDNKDYFGIYTLSQETLDKLREVHCLLDHDSAPADVAWTVIKPKRTERQKCEDADGQEAEDDLQSKAETESVGGSSTQFYFTQRHADSPKPTAPGEASRWTDVAESLLESLEAAGDTPHLAHLKNLSDDEAKRVVQYLGEKLSLKGAYNLCHSLCSLDLHQSMRYARMTCSDLLLRKLIALEEPSRLMSAAAQELVKKFPEDVREFVYIPMLDAEIRETSVLSAIVAAYPSERKNDLILDLLNVVQELKKWHIDVLCQFATSKISDHPARDKMLDLLLAKSSTYSRDKNYGKCVLSFIKGNNPFAETQKAKLAEIVAVNETVFKKVLENLLNNMYLHMELWHVA